MRGARAAWSTNDRSVPPKSFFTSRPSAASCAASTRSCSPRSESTASTSSATWSGWRFWYSTPPLLKQWEDLVLEHGWAYGRQGRALRGKQLLHVISAGGREEAYQHEGYNRFTVGELLAPLEQTAHLCGMQWTPPYMIHGTHRMTEPQIDEAAQRFRTLVLPGTLTEVLIGSRVALMAGWGTVIVAELVAADSGLGAHLIAVQQSYNVPAVMATMLCFALTGFVMNALFTRIERRVMPWRDDIELSP